MDVFDCLIKNISAVNENSIANCNVYIKDGLISTITPVNVILNAGKIIDGTGRFLLPGVIDDQVHFREPGLTHKGEIFTESRAAVAGGVTSFMEMPNTNPQTTTQEELELKFRLASEKSAANFSFYIGATNSNLDELVKTDPKSVCGIKIFMGSSTGNMLVNDKKILSDIFKNAPLLIATHCEDDSIIKQNSDHYRNIYGEDVPVKFHGEIRSAEACFASSSLAAELAVKYNKHLHILHLSTEKELVLLEKKPLNEKLITAEVCVHHLWFDDRDYEKRGTFIKWNPAIKKESDRDALLNAVNNNLIDVIATDHAPHTKEEKNQTYFKAPSGGPLIQHSLVAMLELYHQGKISLEQIANKMCHSPADLFRIEKRGYIREGYFADLVIIDLNDPWMVSEGNILYKCKWSPFEGDIFRSKVTHTFVNGELAYENGVVNDSVRGKRLLFNR
ncbi:MAG TPA: dihydroorotase [Bacteroidales bacterium]|nr:MAG: dihydroorotase [Bacteroidetes bacterium RIFOXYA12_FULL_38_20]HBS86946.1 dihydroorotase [Bacteroidales bacterium]